MNNLNFYSGVFLSERNYTALLGGIERNSSGHIIGAKSTYIYWFTEYDMNEIKKIDPNRDMGLDENVMIYRLINESDFKIKD